MFLEYTLRTCAEYLTFTQREETSEHRAQIFHRLVLCGKLWMEVRWITERERGEVLQTGDRFTKTGYRVMELLCSKHPEARTQTKASLHSYPDRPLELTTVDITDDTVTAVVG